MSVPSRPTQFTVESAQRIASVVRASELSAPPARPLNFERVDFSSAKIFRVATFTGSWSIGSQKTITFKNKTTTPNTVSATNLFFPINVSPPGELDCAVAKEGTSWYLVDVRMALMPAVSYLGTRNVTVYSEGSTAKITIFPTSATTEISFIDAGGTTEMAVVTGITADSGTITFLTDVSVVLDAENCQVNVTKETQSEEVVHSVDFSTAAIMSFSTADIQKAVVFSTGATQTATILTNQISEEIVVIDNVETALFVTLDLFG